MTPPVRPSWDSPAARTLAEALVLAEHYAKLLDAAQTVCLVIDEGAVGFEVMLSASYANLRERELHHRLAPVASVLPNGTTEPYPAIKHLPASCFAAIPVSPAR